MSLLFPSVSELVGCLAACLMGVAGLAQPFPVTQGKLYKFERVADGVYYATGGGGSNNVVIVNDNDILLVDDGTTPASARTLLKDIRLLSNKPVKTVVNTHFHYDHSDGNSVFGPDVQIIAHEYVRHAILDFDVLNREPYKAVVTSAPLRIAALSNQLETEKDPQKKSTLSKQLAVAKSYVEELKEVRAVPPNTTYSSKMILHKGSREIQLLFFGRGHTGGDTFVYLPKEKIICTGDEEEGERLAYMGDAFFDEWIATLDELKKLDFNLVLGGHGSPFREKSVITAFQSYLRDIVQQVTMLRQQGVGAEEAARKVDLTSHAKDFPQIQGPGADIRGMRRIYEWLAERESK